MTAGNGHVHRVHRLGNGDGGRRIIGKGDVGSIRIGTPRGAVLDAPAGAREAPITITTAPFKVFTVGEVENQRGCRVIQSQPDVLGGSGVSRATHRVVGDILHGNAARRNQRIGAGGKRCVHQQLKRTVNRQAARAHIHGGATSKHGEREHGAVHAAERIRRQRGGRAECQRCPAVDGNARELGVRPVEDEPRPAVDRNR